MSRTARVKLHGFVNVATARRVSNSLAPVTGVFLRRALGVLASDETQSQFVVRFGCSGRRIVSGDDTSEVQQGFLVGLQAHVEVSLAEETGLLVGDVPKGV